MSEVESAIAETQGAVPENEEITYQAVEKDGVVTAILGDERPQTPADNRPAFKTGQGNPESLHD
jgi:hypothetical protein